MRRNLLQREDCGGDCQSYRLLRRAKTPKDAEFWVDGIHIKQKDLQERSR